MSRGLGPGGGAKELEGRALGCANPTETPISGHRWGVMPTTFVPKCFFFYGTNMALLKELNLSTRQTVDCH